MHNISKVKKSFEYLHLTGCGFCCFFLGIFQTASLFDLLADFQNHQLIVIRLEDIPQYIYRCKTKSIKGRSYLCKL